MKRLFCPYAKKDRDAVRALWSFPQIQFPTHTLPFTRACITVYANSGSDCPLGASASLPMLQSFPPKLLTDTHDELFTICTCTRSRLPTHMLFFILRGSFSEPSPAQGTPVLLLPVHQHNACPQSSFTLLRFSICIIFLFPKALIGHDRYENPMRKTLLVRGYLFITCHVYFFSCFLLFFFFWPPAIAATMKIWFQCWLFFCPNKWHEAQATCPTC